MSAPNGNRPWTNQEMDRLNREWLKGRQLKIIGHEMDRSFSSLENAVRRGRQRDPDKWPKRFGGKAITYATSLYLQGDILRLAQRRAVERGQSFSAYIRSLIQRDTQ